MARLAAGLDPSRYRSVACLFRDGWLRKRCEESGIETSILGMTGRLDLRWLRRFCRLARRQDVKLIHAHEFGANTYGALAAWVLGIPLIATVHGRHYYADCARRRFGYRIVSHIATMVAVSEDVKRFLVRTTGVAERRIRVVYNGVGGLAPLPAHQVWRGGAPLGLAGDPRVGGGGGSPYGLEGDPYPLETAPQIL